MTVRQRRAFVTTTLWMLFLQSVIGLVVVLHAQPPAITASEQRTDDHVEALTDRVKKLEDLNVGGRLQVLEVLGDRSWRIELLVIGCFVTTGGHLVLQLWERRSRHHGQRHRRFDDDGDDE